MTHPLVCTAPMKNIEYTFYIILTKNVSTTRDTKHSDIHHNNEIIILHITLPLTQPYIIIFGNNYFALPSLKTKYYFFKPTSKNMCRSACANQNSNLGRTSFLLVGKSFNQLAKMISSFSPIMKRRYS